MASQLVYMNM